MGINIPIAFNLEGFAAMMRKQVAANKVFDTMKGKAMAVTTGIAAKQHTLDKKNENVKKAAAPTAPKHAASQKKVEQKKKKVDETEDKSKKVRQDGTKLNDKELSFLNKQIAGRQRDFAWLLNAEKVQHNKLAFEQKSLNIAKDAVAFSERTPKAHKQALDIMNKQQKKVDAVAQRYDDINQRVTGVKDSLTKVMTASPLGAIIRVVDKMKDFNRAADAIKRAGGMTEVLGGFMSSANVIAGKASKNINMAFGQGMNVMLKKGGALLKIFLVGLKGIIASLSAFLIPIALIIAGLFMLKKDVGL